MVRRWNQIERRMQMATLIEKPERRRKGKARTAKLDGIGRGVDNDPI
jgi:hypothetical protein